MPTTTVKTIKSGGDYTTLQAWEDAKPANLVTSDIIWQGQASGTFTVSGVALTVSGSTVDSTRYTELTTEAGASFRDHANKLTNALRFNTSNGCSVEGNASYSATISVNEEFFHCSNLQLANTGGAGSSGCFISLLTSAGSSTILHDCILEASRGVTMNIIGSNSILYNLCSIQRRSGISTQVVIGRGANVQNCTFAVPSDITASTVCVTGSYGAPAYTNCAFFGCSDTWVTGTAPTFTNCYGSDASPPSGVTNAAYSTAQFQNITDSTRDFRIPSGSALQNNGSTGSWTSDIVGTSRPQGAAYDVGCWELVVAAGAAPKSRFVGQAAVNRASTY